MTTALIKKGALYLLAVLLAMIFVALGLWQWDRAEDNQRVKTELIEISNLAPVAFETLHQPAKSLDGASVNRMTTLSGRYIAFFLGRDQQVRVNNADSSLKSGYQSGEYSIGLLQLDNGAGLLIAREFFSDDQVSSPLLGESEVVPKFEIVGKQVELLGRLMPSQREDRDLGARNSKRVDDLPRIDSALLVQDYSLPLYDGYLLLGKEIILRNNAGKITNLNYPPDQIAEPTIPGYYWQHISYVFIWFLMALITLYLPFYQRFRSKKEGALETGR